MASFSLAIAPRVLGGLGGARRGRLAGAEFAVADVCVTNSEFEESIGGQAPAA